MNKKLASSLKLKVIAFEKILELWEENCVKEAEIDYKNAVRTIRESEESELKSKAALSEENLRKVYKYWTNRRKELKRPLLRRYWKYALLKDASNQKVAFRHREKEKMKTRRSTKQQFPTDIHSQLERLRTETEKALIEARLTKNREMIKNYLTELSIKNFYHKTKIPSDIKYNTDHSLLDIQRNFLPENAKSLQEADEVLNKKTEVVIKQAPSDISSVLSNQSGQRATRRVEPPNNDIGYLICSVVSKLGNYKISPEEISLQNLQNLNSKVRNINSEIGKQSVRRLGMKGAETSASGYTGNDKARKNCTRLYLRRRISRSGTSFIDRYDRKPESDLEELTTKDFVQYTAKNSNLVEDTMDKMKYQRYDDINRFVSFDDEKINVESLGKEDYSLSFKKFLDKRKSQALV